MAPASRTRVLLLTASYGSGHNAAARSLAEAFAAERADVRTVDHFHELVHPAFARLSQALYYRVLRWAPALWGAAYTLGDWMPSDSALGLGVTRLGTSGLARLLQTFAPDVVVTVHATPALAMSALTASGLRLPPHTTVVTDFVAHSQWIAPHIDRYCVADDEVRNEFIARGIPRQRVLVTGVPVRAAFAAPADGQAARRRLDLSPDVPVVLAMAGSHGSTGRLPDVTAALLGARRPLQGLVVAGRDAALAQQLRRLTRGSPVRVLDYVDDIRDVMAAADLLVTKAGGMTLAEAIAAELPVLIYGSLAGQERQNERFASRGGIALVARSRRELSALLERALASPSLLERLRDRMRRRRRPDASRRIVQVVLEQSSRA
jgi:processive 1,2-diacylglycerol beta-glucosyltransferase